MSASGALITKLRRAGVVLRREGTRLIVEAPAGVITLDLHAELVCLKKELLASLDQESSEATGEDPTVGEAVREISGLLATAFRRYRAVSRVPADQPRTPDTPVALSADPSVHGVVP